MIPVPLKHGLQGCLRPLPGFRGELIPVRNLVPDQQAKLIGQLQVHGIRHLHVAAEGIEPDPLRLDHLVAKVLF